MVTLTPINDQPPAGLLLARARAMAEADAAMRAASAKSSVFEVQGPDGSLYEVQAPDQESAVRAFQSMNVDQANARAQAGIAAARAIQDGAAQRTAINPVTGQPAGVPGFTPHTNEYGPLGSAGMGAADSTTFGWGDELASYLGSGLSGLPRVEVLQEMRADASKAQDQNPGSYLGGQIGGGLAQALATGGAGFASNAAAKTGSTLGRIALGGMADGGIMSALYGAGSANGDLTDRATGALVGGGVGTLAGGALPYVVSGVTSAVKPLIAPIMARLHPQQYADAALAEALSRSGRTPDEIAQALAAAQQDGQGMFTVADAMGNAGQRVLSTAARNPHEGRQALVEGLQQRQMGQGERLSNALAEGFDAPETATQRIASLMNARSSVADANYAAARQGAGPVDVSGAIAAADNILTPGVNRVASPSGIANDSLESTVQRARSLLTDGQSQITDFNSVLRAKQDIADQIATAVRSGQNNRARVLGQINDQLDAALETSSSGYRQANDMFRTQSRVIDAVDVGRGAASGRTRAADNIGTFNGMTADQQQAFRAGYVDPTIARVESSAIAPTTNKARFLMTEKTGQEFPAFAAPGRADQLGNRVAREQRMFETANAALGGSKTADNLADAADLNKFDPSIMTNLLKGRPVAAVVSALTKVLNESRGMPASVLTRLSRSLMETDPIAARELLNAGTSVNLSAAARKAAYSSVLTRLTTTAAVPALTAN